MNPFILLWVSDTLHDVEVVQGPYSVVLYGFSQCRGCKTFTSTLKRNNNRLGNLNFREDTLTVHVITLGYYFQIDELVGFGHVTEFRRVVTPSYTVSVITTLNKIRAEISPCLIPRLLHDDTWGNKFDLDLDFTTNEIFIPTPCTEPPYKVNPLKGYLVPEVSWYSALGFTIAREIPKCKRKELKGCTVHHYY